MNYLDARRSLMFSVHFNLRNISTLLYNIEEASDSDLISNRLPYLNRECIILDTTIGNLIPYLKKIILQIIQY